MGVLVVLVVLRRRRRALVTTQKPERHHQRKTIKYTFSAILLKVPTQSDTPNLAVSAITATISSCTPQQHWKPQVTTERRGLWQQFYIKLYKYESTDK
jgi:hypothetical protein